VREAAWRGLRSESRIAAKADSWWVEVRRPGLGGLGGRRDSIGDAVAGALTGPKEWARPPDFVSIQWDRRCASSDGRRLATGAERWQRLRPLLERLMDVDASEREVQLDVLCGHGELRRGLGRLLARHEVLESQTQPTAIALLTLPHTAPVGNAGDAMEVASSSFYPAGSFNAAGSPAAAVERRFPPMTDDA
jgi:hypothetical protein